MKNIVILISGGGSNMRAIVDAATNGRWAQRFDARVAAVISNKEEAEGLAFAREHDIAAEVVRHRDFGSREEFDAALAAPSTPINRPWWCWPASCASSRLASWRITRGGF